VCSVRMRRAVQQEAGGRRPCDEEAFYLLFSLGVRCTPRAQAGEGLSGGLQVFNACASGIPSESAARRADAWI